jgi:hypothetical protein
MKVAGWAEPANTDSGLWNSIASPRRPSSSRSSRSVAASTIPMNAALPPRGGRDPGQRDHRHDQPRPHPAGPLNVAVGDALIFPLAVGVIALLAERGYRLDLTPADHPAF